MLRLDAKQFRLQPLVGIVVLTAAIVIILFSGTSGLTEENINQHLQSFADYVAKEAATAGKEAKFTHGTLDIEGWGFNKHATVDNVSLELAEKSSPDTAKWLFSTARMLVIPDLVSTNGLIFVFPGPINLAENGQPKTVITFPLPLKYAYSDEEGNHTRTIAQILYLPNQITLMAAGGENGRVVISYDENPLFREKIMPDGNEREAVYEFHNVKLTTADGMQVTAAVVASRFNEAPGKDNRLQGKYTLTVSDLVVRNRDKVSKAYNLSVDLASSRDMPGANPETAISNTQTAINDMLLATDGFRVRVTGGVATASDDSFPSGNATIDIDNVPQFLASELMPESTRKIVADALQKITGQPVETLTHAAIPLKRDKNGALYVGDTTFTALATSVLADMMQSAAPAAASPEPPPAPAIASPPMPKELAPVAPVPNDSAPMPKSGTGAPKPPAPNSM